MSPFSKLFRNNNSPPPLRKNTSDNFNMVLFKVPRSESNESLIFEKAENLDEDDDNIDIDNEDNETQAKRPYSYSFNLISVAKVKDRNLLRNYSAVTLNTC